MKINAFILSLGLLAPFAKSEETNVDAQHDYGYGRGEKDYGYEKGGHYEKDYGEVEFGTKECKTCKFCDTCLKKLPYHYKGHFDLSNEDLTNFCCMVSAMAFTCSTGKGVATGSEEMTMFQDVVPEQLMEVAQSDEVQTLLALAVGEDTIVSTTGLNTTADSEGYQENSPAAKANDYIRDMMISSSGKSPEEIDMEVTEALKESAVGTTEFKCYAKWVYYYPHLKYLAKLFYKFYPVCHCHYRFNIGCSVADIFCNEDCTGFIEIIVWLIDALLDAFIEGFSHGFLLRMCNGCPMDPGHGKGGYDKGGYVSTAEGYVDTGGYGGKPYDDCFGAFLLVVTLVLKYKY